MQQIIVYLLNKKKIKYIIYLEVFDFMNDYKSFNLLNKIYFERTGGSENELKAANIILLLYKKITDKIFVYLKKWKFQS